jgi:hypothetical protein
VGRGRVLVGKCDEGLVDEARSTSPETTAAMLAAVSVSASLTRCRG